MFPSQFANIFLTYQTSVTNLHLLKVELRSKLQEKLHCVTGPLGPYDKIPFHEYQFYFCKNIIKMGLLSRIKN